MAASDIEHLHQLAVHSYYVGEHDVGRRACERLLAERLTPEREAIVRRNRTWYTRRISDFARVDFKAIDVPPAHDGWTLFNPSICRRGDGYDVLVRSSNYLYRNGRYIMPPEDNGKIRTENILVRLDAAGNPQVVSTLRADYPRNEFAVDGLEDCRINHAYGRTTVSATIRNYEGTDGTCMIGVGEIVDSRIDGIAVPALPRLGRHEKNWMPLFGDASYIYSCYESGHTVAATLHDGRWVLREAGTAPLIARGFRGGSQLIPCDDGWLCLVHEVAEDDASTPEAWRRIYEHRFVWFGSDLSITHVSPPFAFREPRTVEFAAGLCSDGDALVATFGANDETAWMARIDYQDMHDIRVAA